MLFKRKDLFFQSTENDRVMIHRRFPHQTTLEVSKEFIAAFEALNRKITRKRKLKQDDIKFQKQCAAWDLFENEKISKLREKEFKGHLQLNGGLKIPEGLTSYDEDRVILKKEPIKKSFESIYGLVLPHGHLNLVGSQIWKSLMCFTEETWPDTFFITGTSHYAQGLNILTVDSLCGETKIKTDNDFIHEFKKRYTGVIQENSPWFLSEHSWCSFLPLILKMAEMRAWPLNVVATVISKTDKATVKNISEAIYQTSLMKKKRIVVIASSDLTHTGFGYQDTLYKKRNTPKRSAALKSVLKSEKPLLNIFVEGEKKAFFKKIDRTSFCGKTSLKILFEYADSKGIILGHEAYLNFEPKNPDHQKVLNVGDQIFSTATVVLGDQTRSKRVSQPCLCPKIYMQKHGDKVRVLHPCDARQIEGPKILALIIRFLKNSSQGTPGQLIKLIKKHYGEVIEQKTAEGFLNNLRQIGLLFHTDLNNEIYRKNLAWDQFTRNQNLIPAYKQLAPKIKKWEDIPLLSSEDMLKDWHGYFVEPFVWDEKKKKQFYTRVTSGSSGGERMRTVTEKKLTNERNAAATDVYSIDFKKCVNINRPENLFGVRHTITEWPKTKISGVYLEISPGEDLHPYDKTAWDKTVQKVLKRKPKLIHGSPEMITLLIYLMAKQTQDLSFIKCIETGHNYFWRPYERMIRSLVNCDFNLRLHSSEFGPMAVTCRKGLLHLVEKNKYIELKTFDGKEGRPGDIVEPLFTTLDTQMRPLFRYRQGDIYRYQSERCTCGRPFRVIEFLGRTRDVLLLPGHHLVTNEQVNRCFENLEGYYFFQVEVFDDHVKLKLATFDGQPLEVEKSGVITKLENLYARKASYEYASELHKGKAGKLIGLITHDQTHSWKNLGQNHIY